MSAYGPRPTLFYVDPEPITFEEASKMVIEQTLAEVFPGAPNPDGTMKMESARSEMRGGPR